jgi:hypothetical protein
MSFRVSSPSARVVAVDIPLCPQVEILISSTDMIHTAQQLSGVAYRVYTGYSMEYMGCRGSFCGNLVASSLDGAGSVRVAADGEYLIVASLEDYYDAYYLANSGAQNSGTSKQISTSGCTTNLTKI